MRNIITRITEIITSLLTRIRKLMRFRSAMQENKMAHRELSTQMDFMVNWIKRHPAH